MALTKTSPRRSRSTLGRLAEHDRSTTVAEGGTMARLLVWYDGGCPLCQREIALMRKLDRRGSIAFVNIAEGGSVCPMDRSELLARFHAREDGQMLSGAAAFAAMWRAIPVLRPIGLAARNPLVLAGLESLYVWFLRYRPTLQRLAMRLASRVGPP